MVHIKAMNVSFIQELKYQRQGKNLRPGFKQSLQHWLGFLGLNGTMYSIRGKNIQQFYSAVNPENYIKNTPGRYAH